ncbi:MAG TPA: ComF family protein [bacterium]|nr:ComF family protein [bacterium]
MDAVFPPRCPLCDSFVHERACPCEDCAHSVRRLDSEAFVPHTPKSVLSFCRSCFAFEGRVKDALHGFKYGERQDLLSFFAREMALEAASVGGFDLIVPVPLAPRKLSDRGFNQSALIARRMAKGAWAPADLRSLVRARDIPPQVGLEREARIENVRGAFAVRRGREARLDGREILLIDDVMTTGATLAECARALRSAGASSVWALTVARTL